MRTSSNFLVIGVFACVGTWALIPGVSTAFDEPKADPLAGFDAYAEKALADWKVPGMAVAIIKDDKVVFARGYGVRTLEEKGRVDERTIFGIASCTKTFTAACIALFVEEGKLSWDDPVIKHLPDLKGADPYVTKEITVRDLLCHRSGWEAGDVLWLRREFSRQEMLRRMHYLGQQSPFWGDFGYRNLNYVVLGEIVSKVSGKGWETFLHNRIIEPLGMKSTSAVCPDLNQVLNVASAHKEWDGKVQPHPDWHWKDDTVQSMMELMTGRRFRHVPVVDGDGLLGIISIGDVVKNRLEECSMEVDSLRHYVVSSR